MPLAAYPTGGQRMGAREDANAPIREGRHAPEGSFRLSFQPPPRSDQRAVIIVTRLRAQ